MNKHIIRNKKRLLSNNYLKNTTIDTIKKLIQSIQNRSKNKKLVYSVNVNNYDIFHDIEDCYKDHDTDYIYLSNVNDNNSPKNFIHINCNIGEEDLFKLSRMFKFNKTIYNCYDKILYIDANIKIHSSLSNLFNKLNNNADLVLFSHPDRNTVAEELTTISDTKPAHRKWDYQSNLVNIFKKNYVNSMYNKLHETGSLFWLNIQLSNTKHNIYSKIEELYNIYELKRDQIYFPLLNNDYKIKTINIKQTNSDFYKFIHAGKHIPCIDNHYGYLPNWSTYFIRPYGGRHIKS